MNPHVSARLRHPNQVWKLPACGQSVSQCKEGGQEVTGRQDRNSQRAKTEANSNAGRVGPGDEIRGFADSSDRQANQTLASGIISPSVDALVAR